MKIAFWSNVPGKNGVSSNLACISALGALKGERGVIVENHLSLHNMEYMLRAPVRRNYIKEDYTYQNKGLEPLLRQIRCGYSLEDPLKAYGITYCKTLHYLPQALDMNPDFFDFEFRKCVKELLAMLEREGGNVFVDTGLEGVSSTKLVLELADLVVVNLSQNPYIIEHYLRNYPELSAKSIFLIGQYDQHSRFQYESILNKYPLPKKYLAVVPYCSSFADAVREGKVLDFLIQNKEAGRKSEVHYFMEKAGQASDMVWNRIHKGGGPE